MLTKFIENMDIISALDDEPNDVGGLTAEEVKAEFDKGGKLLKDYINGTLTEEMDAHINNTDNPHSVTKKQVGLGNCDNTADTEKPVSTAQQTALDLKADKTNVLEKNNTTEYTPTADYNPATKKYVDKTVGDVVLGQIPDGTITNEKLASSLRGNQPNGINWLDENGDVPVEQLNNVKNMPDLLTWQKIDEITLEQDTAQLDISVPSEYREIYFLITDLKFVSNNTSNRFEIQLNEDKTNNYQNKGYIIDQSSVTIIDNVYNSFNSRNAFDGVRTHLVSGKLIKQSNSIIIDWISTSDQPTIEVYARPIHLYGSYISNILNSIQFIIIGTAKTGSTFEIWGR